MHLALFDFDGTISNRDTTSDFIVQACGKRRAIHGLISLSPIFLAYRLKRISHHEAKQASINHYFGDWEKKAFIEAAHGAVRSGGPWRALFDRHTDGGRKDRQRGYIVVARALVDVVYAVWRDQREYQTFRPTQPASGSARPGTGRPFRPMIAASK